MPALGGLGQGKEMFTDVVLWPLFSKDLILMDGRTTRRKRGRKRSEGREEEYKLPVLARKCPEVPSLEVPDVSVYLFSYVVLRNSASLLMSFFFFFLNLESSSTIPAGNSDIQTPNRAPIVKDKEAELSR